MKRINMEEDLRQIYANHCIKTTAVTILDKDRLETEHISAVIDHELE